MTASTGAAARARDVAGRDVPTRERILDAALRLFGRDGVAGTTITAIENAAGLAGGSGSLYRHFRSKDEILEAVVRREIVRIADAAAAAASASRPVLPDARSARIVELHESLSRLHDVDALILLLSREGHRLTGLALEIRESLVDTWATSESPVVVAALLGHHLAGRFFGGDALGVDDDAFVEQLVDLLIPRGAADPPS